MPRTRIVITQKGYNARKEKYTSSDMYSKMLPTLYIQKFVIDVIFPRVMRKRIFKFLNFFCDKPTSKFLIIFSN